jgi:competence ComEA-like helix-hairpin-helix protein
MIKYRSKGGKFRRKEDLQKLYTLSAEDYERLAPYARFGNESSTTSQPVAFEATPYKNNTPQKSRTLELNGADAEALLSMPGIGPAYSKRIINFRTALGGFVSIEQLKEVYGFPDSTYQQLKDRFTINAGGVKKLNINGASEQELGKHPYIGWKLAGGIIKKRNELGNYSQLEQLKQIPLINDEKYRKIAPYLSTH